MYGRRSDKTRRLGPQLSLDIAVGLARGFMVLHAIGAETPLEEIDDAAVSWRVCTSSRLSVSVKSRSSHFTLRPYSKFVKPVTLPPGRARLLT